MIYVSSGGFFLPDLDPMEVVLFFFVLLLFVWCKQEIPSRDDVKARSTRLDWIFSDLDLSVVVADLLWSWWSLEEPMRSFWF
jgi:hypothetical protein